MQGSTYEQVDRIFAGSERAPDAVAEPLALAREVAAELRRARIARGSLGIESSEPEFEFDQDGHVVAAYDVIQTESHWVIEHLMILANEQVANHLVAARAATIFRVHEPPDPDAVERLVAQLESLDVPTPPLPERLTPTAGRRVRRRGQQPAARPTSGHRAAGAGRLRRSCCAR